MEINKNAHVIYADVEEKFVKNVVLYPNTDKVLHYDAELTMPILPDELANLALKDLVVIVNAGVYAKPLSFTPGNKEAGAQFTTVNVNAGEAVAYKSAVYPAE